MPKFALFKLSPEAQPWWLPGRYCFQGRTLPAILALLALSLLPVNVALALPDDRDQPMRITADTALRDEKQGMTVYNGNVHMVQGSLEIEADKLTIYHETDQANKIVAEGQPAKMQQRPAADEALVKARAQVIEYIKAEERVHLSLDAHIAQDGATVTGNSIDYLIAEQLVKADSDQAQQGNRVEVVIPPQVIRQEDEPDGAAESH